MPDPLTDELTDDAKALLAAQFAQMRTQFATPARLPRLQAWAQPKRIGW